MRRQKTRRFWQERNRVGGGFWEKGRCGSDRLARGPRTEVWDGKWQVNGGLERRADLDTNSASSSHQLGMGGGGRRGGERFRHRGGDE